MKKKGKKVIIIVCSVIALWVVLGIVDFALVHNYRKPLFCVGVDLADDGGSGKYVGLGYSFDIEGNFMPDAKEQGVTSYRGYIFGVEVSRGFWDEMLSGNEVYNQAYDKIPMVMIDSVLYLDTGKSSGDLLTSDVIEGEITSTVDGTMQPTENDQSNFGTGYYYRFGEQEGTVEICMNGKWWIYKADTDTIQFHDKTISRSLLSEETIEWLENYNSLSEEEQLAISSIPSDLYEILGYSNVPQGTAMQTAMEKAVEHDLSNDGELKVSESIEKDEVFMVTPNVLTNSEEISVTNNSTEDVTIYLYHFGELIRQMSLESGKTKTITGLNTFPYKVGVSSDIAMQVDLMISE